MSCPKCPHCEYLYTERVARNQVERVLAQFFPKRHKWICLSCERRFWSDWQGQGAETVPGREGGH